MKVRIPVFTILFSLVLAGVPAKGTARFVLVGPEAMKDFGKRLTDWYAKKNPGVQFEVGTATQANSFASIASGKAEVVESSRRALNAEISALRGSQGKAFVEMPIAKEVAGISLNSSNPVKELSIFQIRQVLSGSVKNWKQVGGNDAPIVIYGREATSGVRGFLEEEFMGDESISSVAKTFPNDSGVLGAVGKDVNGIGFGNVDMRGDSHVRYLAVKASANGEGVAPTGDAIRAGRYKLVRPLYFYFAGLPKAELLRFAQWTISSEGQLVVEAVGYFPLSSVEREEARRIVSGEKVSP